MNNKVIIEVYNWLSENFDTISVDDKEYFELSTNIVATFISPDIMEIINIDNEYKRTVIFDKNYILNNKSEIIIDNITDFQNFINIVKVFNI